MEYFEDRSSSASSGFGSSFCFQTQFTTPLERIIADFINENMSTKSTLELLFKKNKSSICAESDNISSCSDTSISCTDVLWQLSESCINWLQGERVELARYRPLYEALFLESNSDEQTDVIMQLPTLLPALIEDATESKPVEVAVDRPTAVAVTTDA